MWELFDNGDKIDWLDVWTDFKYKSWNITVQDLTFSYKDNLVFDRLNFDIVWNTTTALVWVSWSWKTTLVKLISWFIKPNSWDILVDWQNIWNIKLKSYYRHIWYLTQDPSVFDGSILDNLIYWLENENIDESTIRQAILSAKCEFIYEFKDWLNTQIGERWVRLSWWQKQRLAIAKLFIKNPDIIILDEPTSALDSFSEECIRQSFEKLFKNRTVIIIAHRLQTVKNASEIIVFESWKIIERWNHELLINQNGYYKKMLDLQSGF
jgi:ABC-type multidrug transport system fused ATPase/permease subunit